MLHFKDFMLVNDLLNGKLKKTQILSATSPADHPLNVAVHRSLPFEFTATILAKFYEFLGYKAQFTYSDYDPSLNNLAPISSHTRLHLFWVDWRLFIKKNTPEEAVSWLSERIATAQRQQKAPVIFNNWFEFHSLNTFPQGTFGKERQWYRTLNTKLLELCDQLADSDVLDFSEIQAMSKMSIWDDRNDQISNNPISNEGHNSIATKLAFHLSTAFFHPRIKAIVCDLDNTLYRGVLGEDGVTGLQVTPGHKELQKTLLMLKQSGVMLAISSKNDEKDVVGSLFTHKDFLLKKEDFIIIKANWRTKRENILEIAKELNINTDALLFIDDNPAELLQTTGAIANLNALIALPDAFETARALCYFPGLYIKKTDNTAEQREKDLRAQEMRKQLEQESSKDSGSYLKALDMQLTVYTNHLAHIPRVKDLSNKTNQFNTNFRRMTEEQTKSIFETPYLTSTIELKDRFADSGIIGVFSSHQQDKHATFDEILYSCRALGRGIESISFKEHLSSLDKLGVETFSILFEEGPRNEPAKHWLGSIELVPHTSYSVKEKIRYIEDKIDQSILNIKRIQNGAT